MQTRFLTYSILAVLLTLLCNSAHADQRPNIILLLADDLGYHDLASFGSPHVKTPNLDRLADEGMRFDQF